MNIKELQKEWEEATEMDDIADWWLYHISNIIYATIAQLEKQKQLERYIVNTFPVVDEKAISFNAALDLAIAELNKILIHE